MVIQRECFEETFWNERRSFNVFKPVSYTHLDVYKRQNVNYSMFRTNYNTIFTFFNNHLIRTENIAICNKLTKSAAVVYIGPSVFQNNIPSFSRQPE